MNYCPCCSNLLLRHVSKGHVYWFCRECHQQMPVFSEMAEFSAIVEQLNGSLNRPLKPQTGVAIAH
ncbi:MAG: hypothetical protein MUF49_02850 [Oculatellaceae cyanobacterium Prado106]|nr:hypothetical protein [Oculatellaceae cyanobacterium Prado106]